MLIWNSVSTMACMYELMKVTMTAGVTNSGHAYIRDQKKPKLVEWQRAIAEGARRAIGPYPPERGPMRVNGVFVMPRPKAHYRVDGSIKNSAPIYCTTKPDEDKLRRALLDALTEAAVFVDDAQVVEGLTVKRYVTSGEAPGVIVGIETIENATYGDAMAGLP